MASVQVQNLQRACRRQEQKGQNKMKQDDLNVERKVCTMKLKELQHTSPCLWVCYLQRRHMIALAQDDVDKAKALLELKKKERKANVGKE